MYFWGNKSVLITGHTGFKGSWLSIWLRELGAKVIGYSLDPVSINDNFNLSGLSNKIIDIRGDIRDKKKLANTFKKYKPDIVFHLAAQPIVIDSYLNPFETYDVNLMGTMNVLECIRNCENTRVGVMVTSDKCYENKKNSSFNKSTDNYENKFCFKEEDKLGGYDPYSSSKACCEILISSYRDSFFNLNEIKKHKKAIGSARAGNVIGGGDWSKHRLIPDCIRAIENNQPIILRNANFVRPWQFILELLKGYLILAEKMFYEPEVFSGSYNFGPKNINYTVSEIAELLIKKYGSGYILKNNVIPKFKEADLISLDITKSINMLGWNPLLSNEEMIHLTVDWYKNYRKKNVYDLCLNQISLYEKSFMNQNILNGLYF